jgi:hypothetical protein
MYEFRDLLGEKCIPFGEIIGGKEDPEMFDSSKSQPSVEDYVDLSNPKCIKKKFLESLPKFAANKR